MILQEALGENLSLASYSSCWSSVILDLLVESLSAQSSYGLSPVCLHYLPLPFSYKDTCDGI